MGSRWDRRLLAAVGLAALARAARAGAAPAGARGQSPRTRRCLPGEAIDLVPQALSEGGRARLRRGDDQRAGRLRPGRRQRVPLHAGSCGRAGPLSNPSRCACSAPPAAPRSSTTTEIATQLEADLGGHRTSSSGCTTSGSGWAGAYRLTQHWSLFAEGRAEPGLGGRGCDLGRRDRLGRIRHRVRARSRTSSSRSASTWDRRSTRAAPSVSPVLGFRWRIRDDMRLESQGTRIDVRDGPAAPSSSSSCAPATTATATGSTTRRARSPSRRCASARYPCWSRCAGAPPSTGGSSAGAGSVVYQKWKVEADDDDGGSSSVDAGPAALVWLRCEYRF